MTFEQVELQEVLNLREQYRAEMNCQIVHDSHHERGFTQLYAIKDRKGGESIGYGAVGVYDTKKREIIKEFYLRKSHRRDSLKIFREFIAATGATRVGAQTNDTNLALLLYDTCKDITSDVILFADSGQDTHLNPEGGRFRKLTDEERKNPFDHKAEPVGDWGIEFEGKVVATGGWLTHYNKPYADLYMEVNDLYRKRGFGSYLIQELRREVKAIAMTPAARTGSDNHASRRALERGGMLVCARLLHGTIQPI